MFVKFTYPVKSSLVLREHWPIRVGDIKIEWTVVDGQVTAISGTAPVSDADQLPTIQPSSTPGVKLNINFGRSSRQDEVEEAIRTVWGVLGLFAFIDMDLARVETSWIPENETENELIKVFSYSMGTQKADLLKPRELRYDLAARAMLSAKAAAHYEIPLGFLRRANRAVYDGQYIEAFYNLFFFLETLFAPGYSRPKRVKASLWASQTVRDAVAQARLSFQKNSQVNSLRRDKLLRMTDEEIVHHLVDLRGNLHHHALGRPGIWHPDKADRFKEDAILLQQIVHSIAVSETIAMLYESRADTDLMRSAQEAGAITKIRMEGVGIVDGVKKNLQPIVVSFPGRHVDRTAIDAVHRTFRERFRGGSKDLVLLEYKLMSEDGSQIYAVWQRASQSSWAGSTT